MGRAHDGFREIVPHGLSSRGSARIAVERDALRRAALTGCSTPWARRLRHVGDRAWHRRSPPANRRRRRCAQRDERMGVAAGLVEYVHTSVIVRPSGSLSSASSRGNLELVGEVEVRYGSLSSSSPASCASTIAIQTHWCSRRRDGRAGGRAARPCRSPPLPASDYRRRLRPVELPAHRTPASVASAPTQWRRRRRGSSDRSSHPPR